LIGTVPCINATASLSAIALSGTFKARESRDQAKSVDLFSLKCL
jgi:hypothetical protein